MATSIAEAFHNVELETGRTYRCRVKEFWVELRVLGPATEPSATVNLEADVPMDAWTELPEPSGGFIVPTHWGPPDLPDPPDIPPEEYEA
jgi:hypothetical protein